MCDARAGKADEVLAALAADTNSSNSDKNNNSNSNKNSNSSSSSYSAPPVKLKASDRQDAGMCNGVFMTLFVQSGCVIRRI